MIYQGDCLDILKTLPDNSVDSMVTDPPAGISFMRKEWDNDRGGRVQWMGWVRYIFIECLRVMKPGAHGLIWALPRTSHWTATSLEDAGFEIRDVVNHIFGSGFPKNLNVYKSALKQDLICVCKEHEGTQYQMHDVQYSDLQTSVSTEEHEKSFLQHRMSEQVLSKSGQSEQILCGEESLLARGEIHRTREGLCHDQNAGSSEGKAQRLCSGTHCSNGEEVRQISEGSGRSSSHQSQSLRQSNKESEAIQRSQRALGRTSQTGLHCCQCGKLKKEKTDGLGSSLKPAHENWILVRKPLESKTVAENILEWGCGGINIDRARISTQGEVVWKVPPNDKKSNSLMIYEKPGEGSDSMFKNKGNRQGTPLGRFPSNFILTEGVAVEELDRQSGVSISRPHKNKLSHESGWKNSSIGEAFSPHNDSGGASRFFYIAKASKKDKNEGLDCIEIINISYVTWENVDLKVQLQVDTDASPPKVIGVSGMSLSSAIEWNTFLFGKNTSDPLLGNSKSITKMETSSTIESKTLNWLLHSNINVSIQDASSLMANGGSLVDRARSLNMFQNTIKEKTDFVTNVNNAQSNEYLKITIEKKASNIHPTCKNTKLMSYLITLVTPQGGTVLDPFMGSGSTGVAALRDGFQFIGIEKEPEYFEIAKARIGKAEIKQQEFQYA